MLTKLTKNLLDSKAEYEDTNKKISFNKDKDYKDTHKIRIDLEQDCRKLEDDHQKEANDNFENKMTIDKDKGIEELGTKRFERDLKLQTAFRDFKTEELEKVK